MNPADTPTFDATDLAALVDTVQRFSTERVRPNVDAWEAAGEIPRGLYREAAELGLLGLGYPEHLGGTPAPWRARNALSQTLARHGTSGGLMASLFSHNIGLPPVLAHGTPELQAEVVPPVLRGERIAALGITEPGGGSDVASLRTTARRDGDDYVIDGEKVFITSGVRADWVTLAVRTAPAHKGAGGKARAPASAAKPTVNMYNLSNPIEAVVQGNYRLTHEDSDTEVHHVILSFEGKPFPVLEGQSIGIIPPGEDAEGKPYLPRLYSVSSPRDGERPNYNNVSLTVKREEHGVCSNFVCSLKQGDKIKVTGPFGSTFLMPDDPSARLLMICTGTGSAPFRAFTMRRQRTVGARSGGMTMFFGARTPQSLPYFGPLNKVPETLLKKHLVFSRIPGAGKEYVQDRLMVEQDSVVEMLADPNTHIYICGLRGMEEGVEKAFSNISESMGQSWRALRDTMREDGRYHVETY